MEIKVHFQNGMTGGVLTTEHPRSSYGMPVFVPDWHSRHYLPEDCYGPSDLYPTVSPGTLSNTPLVLDGLDPKAEAETVIALRSQGWTVASYEV